MHRKKETSTDKVLKSRLGKAFNNIVEYDEQIKELCRGKQVKIISDFNGQDMGRSKPPLTGKFFTVTNAFYDCNGITLWLDLGSHSYSTNAVRLKEVEFL